MSIRWNFLGKKESESDLKRDKMIREIMQKDAMQELEYLESQKELYEPCAVSAEFDARMEQLFQKHEMELQLKEKKQKNIFTRYHWKFWEKKESESDLKRDKMIREIMQKDAMQELEYLESQKELYEPCAVSADFDARMDQMLQKHDMEIQLKEKKQKSIFTRYPQIAVVATCVLLVSAVFAGIQTEAIPFPKFNYMKEKDESSYAYLVEQENCLKNTLEEKYEITDIPKGYKLVESADFQLGCYRKYVNEDGKGCTYQQFAKEITARADEIMTNYKEMVFDESKYYIMDKNEIKQILWYANGYQYIILADLQIQELVKMAKSIEAQ